MRLNFLLAVIVFCLLGCQPKSNPPNSSGDSAPSPSTPPPVNSAGCLKRSCGLLWIHELSPAQMRLLDAAIRNQKPNDLPGSQAMMWQSAQLATTLTQKLGVSSDHLLSTPRARLAYEWLFSEIFDSDGRLRKNFAMEILIQEIENFGSE